jgi:hypothetical protein
MYVDRVSVSSATIINLDLLPTCQLVPLLGPSPIRATRKELPRSYDRILEMVDRPFRRTASWNKLANGHGRMTMGAPPPPRSRRIPASIGDGHGASLRPIAHAMPMLLPLTHFLQQHRGSRPANQVAKDVDIGTKSRPAFPRGPRGVVAAGGTREVTWTETPVPIGEEHAIDRELRWFSVAGSGVPWACQLFHPLRE